MIPAVPPVIDPLAAFVAGAFTTGERRPVPLVATAFAVTLDAGLAIVETTRRYRNAEAESIEATITFPVPVQATLYALEARLDGRLLTGRAQRRRQARETYEAAITRGKAAVLHEELLRGVHQLSVANIPPGGEVEVRTRWAVTLTLLADRASLRIPLTVGDIYGRSGLPDSDELIHAAPAAMAELAVDCRNGQATVRGVELREGRAAVPTDAPIDLEVTGWSPRPLLGRAADGRLVTLRIDPVPAGEAALDLAILVDHSGSMNEACGPGSPSKHRAVAEGLVALAERLGRADAVELWEFDNALTAVGSTRQAGLADLARRLSPPRGGTEIGGALAGVVRQSSARDLLLITDGKSHALDVQALARAGRRIVVVLVGEDSLEARVGHLAAISGGEIFVAAGADITDVLLAAFACLRRPGQPPRPIEGPLTGLKVTRAGATLSAEWQAIPLPKMPDENEARAVAAVAAALALPALGEDAAATLAAAENLVTHLTSLVLVDEAGATQEGLPAARKVTLPSPRTAFVAASMAPPMPDQLDTCASPDLAQRPAPSGDQEPKGALHRFFLRAWTGPKISLAKLAEHVDWATAPQALLQGDLSGLDAEVAKEIRLAASRAAVIEAAQSLGIAPVVLVLALMARARGGSDRHAARIARSLIGEALPEKVRELWHSMGLE